MEDPRELYLQLSVLYGRAGRKAEAEAMAAKASADETQIKRRWAWLYFRIWIGILVIRAIGILFFFFYVRVLLPQSNLWRSQKRLVYRLCIGTGARGKIGIIWETMGSGCAVFDADGDGDLDLYFVNGEHGQMGGENALYRNDGGFRFSAVSGAPGVGYGMGGYGLGIMDNDGDLDLYTTGL